MDIPTEIPEFPGVVTSRVTRVVSAEFQGRVDDIQISAGQRVRRGDPIAKLDDTALQAQILTARGQERAARARSGAFGAQAAASAMAAKRERRLVASGASSRANREKVEADRNAAGANAGAEVATAEGHKAERERLEALVAKAQVTSPIDGIVMMVRVKEGELAQQGAPLARVFDPKDLIMKFAVPKEHRAKVAIGKRVELRIDGVDSPVWATIERIADEEPPITFAVVEADIDDSKLRPDEIRVASQGHVRIADASAGGKR